MVEGGEHGQQRIGARQGTSICWDGDRLRLGRQMILCGDTTGVGVGGAGAVGGCPPQKDTMLREGRAGREEYKYVTISDRA